MSVSEGVAVDSFYDVPQKTNVSKSTICGVLHCVIEVSLMDVFLRSYAEGRWMMHAHSVSGLQTPLLQLELWISKIP